jgi:hypothetical protein
MHHTGEPADGPLLNSIEEWLERTNLVRDDLLFARRGRAARDHAVEPLDVNDAGARVILSRYGIWAATAANRIGEAMNALGSKKTHSAALLKLQNVAVSLRAFVETRYR